MLGLAREPVHQRQLGGAGVAEHELDTLLLQDLEEGLLAGQKCHECPPGVGLPQRVAVDRAMIAPVP